MNHQRLPPPEPEDCLIQSRVSRYKGGTLIAEDVWDLGTHLRCLADPDGYRPEQCPRCGGRVLHIHDYLYRKRREKDGPAEVRVVRHICAEPTCMATWRILPAFIARHLQWSWQAIESTATVEPTAIVEAAPSGDPPTKPHDCRVPKRTVERWQSRLEASAKQLVVLLATSGGALLETMAKLVGLWATRHELVDVHAVQAQSKPGRRLSELAALVYRLERGIRLM